MYFLLTTYLKSRQRLDLSELIISRISIRLEAPCFALQLTKRAALALLYTPIQPESTCFTITSKSLA